MASNLDKSLDEIIGDDAPRHRSGPRRPNHERSRHRERSRERRHPARDNDYRSDRYVPPRQTKLQRLSKGRPYLKISNLHYDISEDDLKSLFGQIGDVSFVSLIYNPQGRHSGLGYLGYENTSLDRDAIDKFDGRKAVGQVITVEEIKPLNIGISPRYSDSRSAGSNSRPRQRVRERRTKPTSDDLDKDLESYMSENTTSQGAKRAGSRQKKTAEDLDKELEAYMNADQKDKPFPAVV